MYLNTLEYYMLNALAVKPLDIETGYVIVHNIVINRINSLVVVVKVDEL